MICLDAPSITLRLTPSVFSKWNVKVVHIPGKIYWYLICIFQVLHFHTSRNSFYPTSGWIFGKTSGSPTKLWECQGPKYFQWFGEWHKSKFSGKYPWQTTISEKWGRGGEGLGRDRSPPFLGGITPLNVVNFVWNFDQWWDARWCMISKGFYWGIKKWLKLRQKNWFFDSF